MSTPIGTFAIGPNAEVGYELWKWDGNGEVVGVTPVDQQETLKFFPNPAQDMVQIISHQPIEVQLVNLVGATVATYQLNEGTNQLTLNTIPVGVYFVTTPNGKQHKLIKN